MALCLLIMTEIILQILIKNYPTLAGYFIVILTVGFIVFEFTKFYLKTKQSCNKFDGIYEKTKIVCHEFDNIKLLLNKMYYALGKLNSMLLEKDILHTSCFSEQGSPRRLNGIGQRLYEQSGSKKVLEKILNQLIEKLEMRENEEKEKFDSLLDIERESLNLMTDERDNPEFKDIQNFVYYHSSFEGKPLTYSDVLFVMSLILRDEYIKRHPELLS